MADEITALPAPLAITVDDGMRRVPVMNQDGDEIGFFKFRPTDVGIVERYNRMVGRFDELTDMLKNISITPEGEAADETDAEAVATLEQAKNKLFSICDEMFGGNMSQAFFGAMHPFSPVNGAFYCENAIEAVGNFIAAQFDSETAKITKRVQRYTAGYKPGQRRRK